MSRMGRSVFVGLAVVAFVCANGVMCSPFLRNSALNAQPQALFEAQERQPPSNSDLLYYLRSFGHESRTNALGNAMRDIANARGGSNKDLDLDQLKLLTIGYLLQRYDTDHASD